MPLSDHAPTNRTYQPLRWRIERVRDPDHPLYKPRLRGWVHAVMAPLVLAAGIVLIVLAIIVDALFIAAQRMLRRVPGIA